MDKLIVITEPENFDGESELVELMLREGIDRVHIRKYSATDAESLIAAIDSTLRPRLRVHYHKEIAEKFNIELHQKSRSCHSPEELSNDVEYQFLSPIYDSISKQGYKSRFNLATLRVSKNVYALGGVEPCRFAELEQAGFGGAAMLGYIWADHNPETIKKRIYAAIHHSQ